MSQEYVVAVVGATGVVGKEMISTLESRDFPIKELRLLASERSAGQMISFRGDAIEVQALNDQSFEGVDYALFSAGGSISKQYCPIAVKSGAICIDNSSHFRMDADVPLVVPEVNPQALENHNGIIANPNCSTIQMVVALAPLHRKYKIKRLVISTYQSFTGTGMQAVKQYQLERKGYDPKSDEMAYHYQIFENCLPHCDIFLENDYTKEEMKLVHETRKILGDDKLAITATAVRVPVHGGHSESVNVEFESAFDVAEVRELLAKTPGVIVEDDPANNKYPMPLYAKDRNEVLVGRIRRDESIENGLNLWIVSDNLRKGAATNAVQIAKHLMEKELLGAKAVSI